MKNIILLISTLSCFKLAAQQHFSGINTSSHTTIVNGGMNPAELANITSKYEINVLASSTNVSNNKIGFNDLLNGNDFESLIFQGSDAVDVRTDGEILGPGLAYMMDKWTVALTTKAYAKLDMVAIDVHIGDAIANGGLNSLFSSTTISSDDNQRVNGTTWGEVGLSAARNIYDDDTQKFSAGVSLKILFPGSYSNFGADKFTGTINNTVGNGTLTDATANLNIAYSGNLADSFTDFNDYAGSLFGKLNGLAADIGVNYQLKDNSENGKYKVNAGLSVRNIGGMTFKSANNSSTNYELKIEGNDYLDLNQFQDVNSMQEVEDILLQSGYLNKTENNTTDFKVALPTVFTAYADVRIFTDFFVTGYTQQKLKKNEENDQITNENITSLTPRYLLSNVEFMLPVSISEVSGFTGGVGFRAYGFYIGSSSILTGIINNSYSADAYIGYSFGLK